MMGAEVSMSGLVVSRTASTLLVVLSTAGCSGVARTPPLVRPAGVAAERLVDLRLPPGTECVVRTVSGTVLRGKLQSVGSDRLEIDVWDAFAGHLPVSIDHADILQVAKVVRVPAGRRGWLGAAIGALISLPFGISMVGDMVIPGAFAGALVGRAARGSRTELVYERPPVPPA